VTDPAPEPPRTLPPGQHQVPAGMPVLHYGPVPRFRPETWRLSITGANADGCERHLDMEQFDALPTLQVVGDMHCVTRWTSPDNTWEGVAGRTLLDLVPPAPRVTHVMAWAEYGYSATVRIEDFAANGSVLATHLGGEPLTPQRGWPLRLVIPHLYAWKGPKWLRMIEYLDHARRGFWEERGYHIIGDPWQEERYSYLE
jgi:DMSO/TMAO reductase YedYZ molybdopterin-dependent catalytic subunit